MSYELHQKNCFLYYVQADHLRGEEIGGAIRRLYDAGAHNVNVVPSVTKKNRPGYVFFIDTDEAGRDTVEDAIQLELRVSGWHCVPTRHSYLTVNVVKRTLRIEADGKSVPFQAEIKIAYGAEKIVRPEFRSCEQLKEKLEEIGIRRSINACADLILDAFRRAGEEA